jgi:hypothetical protein
MSLVLAGHKRDEGVRRPSGPNRTVFRYSSRKMTLRAVRFLASAATYRLTGGSCVAVSGPS